MRLILLLILLIPTVSLHGQVVSKINAEGNLLVNNIEFFPIGFHCEGLNQTQHPTLAQDLYDDHFNVMITESSSFNLNEYDLLLNQCDSLGLKNMIILPMYDQDPTRFTNFVNAIKSKPSVISWNVLQNANQSNTSALQNQKNKLIQLDGNNRITTAEFTETGPPFQYMLHSLEGSMFYHGPWDYPWAVPQDLDLSAYMYRDHAVMSKAKSVFPMAFVQTHNYENTTFPTPAHLDAQSYLAVSTGNKGILFYELRDLDNNVRISVTQPALYAQASKIAEEILESDLKDVFLHGTHTYFNPGPDIHFATWKYNNQLFVIAVNSSITNSISVNVPILFNITGQPQNFFSYRPDSLYLENGALKGELDAMQVAIYKFNLNELNVSAIDPQRLNVYPNPVSNTFKVSGLLSDFSYEFYSLSGTLLKSAQDRKAEELIDIAAFPKGVYLLNIKQEGGSVIQTIKIIKN